MITLFLDADLYANKAALHEALKRLLHLPDYYGNNADALYDCLSERTSPVSLHVRSQGTGETQEALRTVCHVIEDLGGTVTGMD